MNWLSARNYSRHPEDPARGERIELLIGDDSEVLEPISNDRDFQIFEVWDEARQRRFVVWDRDHWLEVRL